MFLLLDSGVGDTNTNSKSKGTLANAGRYLCWYSLPRRRPGLLASSNYFQFLGLQILKAETGIFLKDLIIFFMDHFAVEFPKFGQHLFLFVFVKIFLTGIEEVLIFFWIILFIFFSKN